MLVSVLELLPSFPVAAMVPSSKPPRSCVLFEQLVEFSAGDAASFRQVLALVADVADCLLPRGGKGEIVGSRKERGCLKYQNQLVLQHMNSETSATISKFPLQHKVVNLKIKVLH